MRYTGPKIEGGVVYEASFSLSEADAITKLFELLLDVALLAEAGGGGGVPTGRLISTTAPLSGGGDLSANRTLSLDDDGITDAKLRNSAALSVIGRSANSTGDPADIAAANDGEVLRRSGTALGFGTVATAGIADDAVTYAKLQNVSAASKLLGRGDSGAGDPQEITLGAGLTMTGTTLSASGSSGGGAGHAEVDFGALPGKLDASVAVTGQAGILAGSVVKAWIRLLDTPEHTADEHMIAPLKVFAGNIVPGTGFTIYVLYDSALVDRLSNADWLLLGQTSARPNFARNTGTTRALSQNTTSMTYGRWSVSWEWI